MSVLRKIALIVALSLLFSLPTNADTRIAVLNFELNDLTSNPRVTEELERTASLKSLLENSLAAKGDYKIITVDRATQAAATKSVGYLWDYPDEAAELGKPNEAQFVLVGRVTKPSFLFVYFEVRLIDVKTKKSIGEFYVEVKGQQNKFTPKGIENLSRKIDSALQLIHSQKT